MWDSCVYGFQEYMEAMQNQKLIDRQQFIARLDNLKQNYARRLALLKEEVAQELARLQLPLEQDETNVHLSSVRFNKAKTNLNLLCKKSYPWYQLPVNQNYASALIGQIGALRNKYENDLEILRDICTELAHLQARERGDGEVRVPLDLYNKIIYQLSKVTDETSKNSV